MGNNIICLSLITGVITDSELLNSETETQTSLPDIPYEPDLDIELDFPRGLYISKMNSLNIKCNSSFPLPTQKICLNFYQLTQTEV